MLQFLVLQRVGHNLVTEQQLISKGKAKNLSIIPEKSTQSNKENRSITQHLTFVHDQSYLSVCVRAVLPHTSVAFGSTDNVGTKSRFKVIRIQISDQ